MRKFFNRGKVLLTAFAIVVMPLSWWMFAGVRGNLHARYDMAHGQYVIHLYGLPSEAFPEYQRLLSERYGVEVRAMGCIPPLTSHDESYDHVVIATVNAKFGHDIFKEVSDQANEDWKEHKAELRNVSRSE